ncbi:hypothetical protein NESM_000934300 [Novymonas esmeraldas]|uniref:Apple domain-containing protein n=1 Tax=Novymonas esmeraldas TaxID=1808958 RepID=A0AAW0F043_9TRYP
MKVCALQPYCAWAWATTDGDVTTSMDGFPLTAVTASTIDRARKLAMLKPSACRISCATTRTFCGSAVMYRGDTFTTPTDGRPSAKYWHVVAHATVLPTAGAAATYSTKSASATPVLLCEAGMLNCPQMGSRRMDESTTMLPPARCTLRRSSCS